MERWKLGTGFFLPIFARWRGRGHHSLTPFTGPWRICSYCTKFIKQLLNDEHPIINGDGKQSRDFTYIERT